MRIFAIDPGSEESAYVIYEAVGERPVRFAKVPNDGVITAMHMWGRRDDRLVVEMIASYGMPVGADVFGTCVWVGRFAQEWNWTDEDSTPAAFVYRREVKLHLCNSARAKDANVRQALIDRYGGREKAIGRKATPGPLYGLSGDCWAALGVAVTAADRDQAKAAA